MKPSSRNQDSIEQLTFDSFFEENIEDEKDSKQTTLIGTKPSNNISRKSFPIHLVLDFNHFLEYVASDPVNLTKLNEYITRKHLPEINERLSIKAENATKSSQQEYYPYIHFLYYLALGGRLVEKISFETDKPKLRVTERWNLYQSLTDAEKYCFLLESFWVDTNWAHLQNKRNWEIHHMLPEILGQLIDEKSAYRFQLNNRNLLARFIYDWHYFLLYFEWFGFWVCEKDQERMDNYGSKNCYFAKSITLTEFGKKMIPINGKAKY